MIVRRLLPSDVGLYRELRLRGLRESPAAFGSSYAEEVKRPLEAFVDRLRRTPATWTFGAFENKTLVGMLSLVRHIRQKERHKATIYGMYVEPKMRGKGIGRQLLVKAVDTARKLRGVRQVGLSVVESNIPALRLYESLGFEIYGREADALFVSRQFYAELFLSFRLSDQPNQPPACRAIASRRLKTNPESRPSSGDPSASETPSSPGRRD